MLDGTVTLVLLLERGTVNPPEAAAELRDTVHGVVPAPVIVVFVQLSPLKVTTGGGTVVGTVLTMIVPEPPLAGMELAAASTPMTFVI